VTLNSYLGEGKEILYVPKLLLMFLVSNSILPILFERGIEPYLMGH